MQQLKLFERRNLAHLESETNRFMRDNPKIKIEKFVYSSRYADYSEMYYVLLYYSIPKLKKINKVRK